VFFQVPNEPFVFAEDPQRKERSEDAIIAWTWSHFGKRPQDSEWLLRLPMTKVGGRSGSRQTGKVESNGYGGRQVEMGIQRRTGSLH